MANEQTDGPALQGWVRAPAIRSRVILEMAAELVADDDLPFPRAQVILGDRPKDPPLDLRTTTTIDGVKDVVEGRASLAMMNPASMLSLAARGSHPWTSPQPVRLIGVIPSFDQYVFAVKSRHGLRSFEDIGRKRIPLKISVRAQKDHCLHLILRHVCEASGFSVDDVAKWGGELRHDGGPRDPKSEAVARGADAVFDEAVQAWLNEAIDLDMTILTLEEPTIAKLEKMGYRRSVIRKADWPRLPHDITTVDFSGWSIYVRADMDANLVERMCYALDKRKSLIPWQEPGPLPVERMCKDARDTPVDVPLHPGAERAWKALGYL